MSISHQGTHLSVTNTTMTSEQKLNFPWFIYPGTPFSGYMAKHYVPELMRLEKNLHVLNTSSKQILFHLTIGSPMEEAGITTLREQKSLCQLYQLIPDHILRAGKQGIKVVSYIVCPNIVSVPLFMETEDFIKKSDTSYEHKQYPITIEFFNTMMPTNDKTRNDRHMKHFKEHNFDNIIPDGIEMYRQTDFDRSYIVTFYDLLQDVVGTIERNHGLATCFSFAVFNDDTMNRRFNRCIMFKEILNCFSAPRCLMYEWTFRYGNFLVRNMHDIPSYLQPTSLCYVPAQILNTDAVCRETSHIISQFTIGAENIKIHYGDLPHVTVSSNIIPCEEKASIRHQNEEIKFG